MSGNGWQLQPFDDPAATEEDVLLAWEGDIPDYGGALSTQVRASLPLQGVVFI